MDPDFSIIVCTYHPDPDLFGRLLQAISELTGEARRIELIIVDNNSQPALSEREYIHQALGNLRFPWQIIREPVSGLTPARLAGSRAARGGWLVFFDDDNEPASDYLDVLSQSLSLYPEVGCWGPGQIEVEYVGSRPDPWLEEQKPLFQQRKEEAVAFDGAPQWQACYPFGTGMAIRREILEYYADQVSHKRYTLSDRKGRSLASGGDVQIVLSGIRKGFKAGILPQLRMRHLITADKARIGYLEKQSFGTASCNLLAHEQVFPEWPYKKELLTNRQIVFRIYSVFRNHYPVKGWRGFRLRLSQTMGEINARYVNAGVQPPLAIRWYQRLIHA